MIMGVGSQDFFCTKLVKRTSNVICPNVLSTRVYPTRDVARVSIWYLAEIAAATPHME